ncbi:YgfZ/GcvT domain-containing protein [Marinomonas balearica]|uniref:GCVT N-terminal domain-containing protein n=1 Tax=Marinomonas balearica TaxID=491947 RepID=A0A4R6MG53_9GAMM|nr:folate-binding protein YgfZ [Marinomonas balearica]TDP00487.1 hypothetical protein DFP79_0296 [Marinomonas balearica]
MQLADLLNTVLPTNAARSLTELGFIHVEGKDAQKFLQGQVTADVSKVTNEASSFGATCTPKGRVISNFLICQVADEQYLLTLHSSLVEKTLAHFKKYAVFFKATLTDASDTYAAFSEYARSLDNDETPQDEYALLHPTQKIGDVLSIQLNNTYFNETLSIAATEHLQDQAATNEEAHRVISLLATRPFIELKDSEEILPQWFNMQRNGSISFTKGCYTGQEIVARMKYRGKSKKHMALVSSESELTAGMDVTNQEGKTIGTLHDVASFESSYVAQAILNVDQEELELVMLDGKAAELLALPYGLD